MVLYRKLKDKWESKCLDVGRNEFHIYAPRYADEVKWLWKRSQRIAAEKMKSEYRIKEKDNEAKLFNIIDIPHQILENVYKDETDKVFYRSIVEMVLERSIEDIRRNKENYSRTMFIEEFLVDPTQRCSWEGAKLEFIKFHYF